MSECPGRELLKLFLDGDIDPPRADPVSRHIETCESCRSALDTLTRDARFDTSLSAAPREAPSPAFLARLKGTPPGGAAPASVLRPPTIPGYEIEEELGRGGAGVVYKARQRSLDRTVALKVMLGGAHIRDDDLARFRAEALAAGKLSHPGIVKVHEVGEWVPDAGTRPLPYLSLEYVRGGSWDRLLARTPQTPGFAAESIIRLATAVHAAHREGIIHRDIKPANVLVDSATGLPKIADFGLAKQLQLESGLTATGMIMGTPSYMAPEQAKGERGIDARADVYGLGAVLYELLTGRPPFQGPTALDTLVQVVKSDPIPPRRLQPTVPRDLETICLKCLEKDPARRYQTAEALAEDVARFVAGRPIVARPLGLVGRAAKVAKRHPVVVTLAGALAGVVVGSIVALSALYSRAVAERTSADSAREKALEEKANADIERGKAVAAKTEAEAATALEKKASEGVRAVSEFFQRHVLAAPRPRGVGAGFDVTLQQAIDDAEGKIAEQFRDQPEIEAAVRDTLANTYYRRGQYEKAAQQSERVLALRRSFQPPDHHQVLSAQNNLGLAYLQLGRFTEAEPLLRDTVTAAERALGPDSHVTLIAMNSHAGYLILSGQHRAAAGTLRKALAAATRTRPGDDIEVLQTKSNLCGVLINLRQFQEAEALIRDVLRVYETRYPAGHPEIISARSLLGDVFLRTGRIDDAERLATQTVEETVQAYGPSSPQTFRARVNVLVVRGERGDVDAVVEGAKKFLDEPASATLAHHPGRLDALTRVAMFLIDHSRFADASAVVDEVLARQRKSVPQDNPTLATTLVLHAECLVATGKPGEAEKAVREAIAIREKRLPPGHWLRAYASSLLGECLAAQKDFAAAEPLLLKSYDALQANEDVARARLNDVRERLRRLYLAMDKPDTAANWMPLPAPK